jgi:hypothetical protein
MQLKAIHSLCDAGVEFAVVNAIQLQSSQASEKWTGTWPFRGIALS